jgi:hypothetical protein
MEKFLSKLSELKYQMNLKSNLKHRRAKADFENVVDFLFSCYTIIKILNYWFSLIYYLYH